MGLLAETKDAPAAEDVQMDFNPVVKDVLEAREEFQRGPDQDVQEKLQGQTDVNVVLG